MSVCVFSTARLTGAAEVVGAPESAVATASADALVGRGVVAKTQRRFTSPTCSTSPSCSGAGADKTSPFKRVPFWLSRSCT